MENMKQNWNPEKSVESCKLEPHKERHLTTIQPEIIARICEETSCKKYTLVHYKNPLFGSLNSQPCINSHCAICPLGTVDYKPPVNKRRGPRKNVSRRTPKAKPKSMFQRGTTKLKATPAMRAKKKVKRKRNKKQ